MKFYLFRSFSEMAPSKKLQYSEQDLQNALLAVENGMSFYKASQIYNIPKTTLLYKKSGKTPMARRMGPETILSEEEENLIVKWIFYVGDRGFPVSKDYLLDSVQVLVKKSKRPNPFSNNRPGRKWYEAFLRRHPEISVRVSQNLTNSRSQVTEEKIRMWFSEVKTYLESNSYISITKDPRRIYNCDESAFFLSPKDNKVLVRKGEKAVYNFVNNDEKECITTLIMCNAEGDLPPPMVVFSYKRIPHKIVEKVPRTWGIGHTDSGWMTGESFFEYITNIFYKWLRENDIEFPVILFVDGHSSHMTMALSEFCSHHGIILVCLYPNSTHILQPLDVAFFHPLKNQWKKTVYQWRIDNHGQKLAREDFASLLNSTLCSLEHKTKILQNGFRSCGLQPFDPNNINFDKIFKTTNSKPMKVSSHEYHEVKKMLDYMDKDIPQKIALFKLSGVTWNGTLEDKSLFEFWKGLKDKIVTEKPDVTLEINNNTSVQIETLIEEVLLEDTSIQDLRFLEPNTIYIPIDGEEYQTYSNRKDIFNTGKDPGTPIVINVPSTSEMNISKSSQENADVNSRSECSEVNKMNVISELSPKKMPNGQIEQTPKVDETYRNMNTQQITPKKKNDEIAEIPTPFKEAFNFWPENVKENQGVKRKPKEKIPAVASSEQWLQYFRKKEEMKEKMEKEKEARKQARIEKKGQKKKPVIENHERSDSDNSEIQTEEENFEKKIECKDYVVVKYDNSYFPGIILDTNQNENDELEFKVKVMVRSGLNWKWPEPDDILWYSEEDVLEKIEEPKRVTKRGSYYFKEMKKYYP